MVDYLSAYMFSTNVGVAVGKWSAVSLIEPAEEWEIQPVKKCFLSPTLKTSPSVVFPFRILPDVRRIPGDSSSQECGQEENADPVLFRLNHLSGCHVRRETARMYGCIVWSWQKPNNPTSSGNTTCHCVRGATKGLASDRNAFCACQAA